MTDIHWKNPKKRKLSDEEDTIPNSDSDTIFVQQNHIHFNGDISNKTAFLLKRELLALSIELRSQRITLGIENQPIYLHLTTNGGDIYAAFSVVDCISKLKSPVYTIIDGYCASSGTLISLAGEKRFINENAYMLIHELRSCMSWGKMTSIDEEYINLRKIMDHIIEYYIKRSGISRKRLERILKKDLNWNADECIKNGLVEGKTK